MSTDEESHPENRARDSVARAVSYVISPLLLPVVTASLLLYVGSADGQQVALALTFVVVSFFILPVADVALMLKGGRTTSIHLPGRRDRIEPLVVTALGATIGLLLYRSAAPSVAQISVLGGVYLVNVVVALIVTTVWKISLHTIAMGGLLGVSLYVLGPLGGPTLPGETVFLITVAMLVPVVAWSRVQMGLHSGPQVVVGAFLGFFGHWAAFYLLTPLLSA